MTKLTDSEWNRILRSIEVLNSGIETESLAKRLIASTTNLIANDITSYEAFANTGDYIGIIVYDPIESVSHEHLEAYYRYLEEHPLFTEVFVQGQLPAKPLVDTALVPGFEKTRIYNEYYQPVKVDHQLSQAYKVNDDAFVTCALNRTRRAFNDADREMVRLFQPQVAAAIRNSWLFDKVRMNEQSAMNVLDLKGVGAIRLGLKGGLEFISRGAVSILNRFFNGQKFAANGLPETLSRWALSALRSRDELAPPDRFEMATDSEKLSAEVLLDQGTGDLTIIFDVTAVMNAARLERLGLTKAQAKVLYWITLGKSNEQIAEICGSSPRTVQKHIENICDRLGVDNRTSAAMIACSTK
ncbi:MAG TPA: helix-turn-helix domain-containing protein [Pyrinomonadaceae bacterium]|nr:helix-turn-helix domain-containing protein [Pyrinomonadaceae bacterium]